MKTIVDKLNRLKVECISNLLFWNSISFLMLGISAFVLKVYNYDVFTLENVILLNCIYLFLQTIGILVSFLKRSEFYGLKCFTFLTVFTGLAVLTNGIWYQHLHHSLIIKVLVGYAFCDIVTWLTLTVINNALYESKDSDDEEVYIDNEFDDDFVDECEM